MQQAPSSENNLSLYTIYYNTSDWPGEFVIKRWHVAPPENETDEAIMLGQDLSYLFNARTLEECRQEMRNMGLENLGRRPEDDKVIIESWM